MNKDLQRLITETIAKTFAEAPEKLIERGIREIQYDICPHCKTEIHEKHEYTEDGGTTWRHSDCKGLISRPETPLDKINDWLRPYVAEARAQRHKAREALGYAPLASDDDAGVMNAVNTTGLPEEKDPYQPNDDESGKTSHGSDNDPASKNYDPDKPTVILHPFPKAVPQQGTNESSMKKNERTETKLVPARNWERFMDNTVNVVNASNRPLTANITEFTVDAGGQVAKTFIVHIDNG